MIGRWRGEGGRSAEMTLVWGVPLLGSARVATAELGGLSVDQCAIVDDRFTLIAPDAYRSDYLDVKLWDADGRELASESLYVDDDEERRGVAVAVAVEVDAVDQPVVDRLLRREEAVALHVAPQLLDRSAGVLGVDLLHPPAQEL